MNSLKFTNMNPVLGLLLIGLMGISMGSVFSFITEISIQYVVILEIIFIVSGICIYTGRTKQIFTAILLVTIPINIDKTFFFDEFHSGGVQGLVISIWSIALIVLYIAWLIESWNRKNKEVAYFPHITIPMVLLILISVLSMIKSVYLSLSLYAIIQTLKVFLLFFYIANNIRSEKDYKLILYILLGTFFFEIGMGYFQYFLNDFIDLSIFSDAEKATTRELGSRKIVTVYGTLSGDACFGDYLSLNLFVVLALLNSRIKLKRKSILLPIFAAGIMLLIFTFSRGAWIGFGSGFFLFLLLKFLFNLKNPRIYVTFLLFVMIVLIVGFAFQDLIIERFYGEDYGSAESRIPMMQIAFEMIRNNLFYGVGINNYTRVVTMYDPTGLTYVYLQPVHNLFLQLTAEIGIFGLIVFLWIIARIYITAIGSIFKSNDFFQNQSIGLISGITALLIHGLVNNATIGMDPFILFWVFAGLIHAITRVKNNQSHSTRTT